MMAEQNDVIQDEETGIETDATIETSTEEDPPGVEEKPVEATPPDPESGQAKPGITVEEARRHERTKLRKTIDDGKAKASKLAGDLETEKSRATELESRLKTLETANLSDGEKIKLELEEARTQILKLNDSLNILAEDSAQQIQKMRMDTYRERRIREEGVRLVEMVQGSNEEEIEDSLEAAKVREADIRSEIETAHTEEVRKSLPAAPAPDATKPATQQTSKGDLRSLAGTRDYADARDKMLQEAKRKAGLTA